MRKHEVCAHAEHIRRHERLSRRRRAFTDERAEHVAARVGARFWVSLDTHGHGWYVRMPDEPEVCPIYRGDWGPRTPSSFCGHALFAIAIAAFTVARIARSAVISAVHTPVYAAVLQRPDVASRHTL
jgi:hypothetical protein